MYYYSSANSQKSQPVADNSVASTSESLIDHDEFDGRETREIYFDRPKARIAGYRSAWEWRRRYRQVMKGADAEAVLFVLGRDATPYELDFCGGWHGSLQAIHGGRLITRKVALYRVDQTKTYHPTERTEALWTYGDLFVANRERYALRVNSDRWHNYEADGDVRLLLNDTSLGNHCRGKHTLGVFAETRTEFLVVRVTSLKYAEILMSQSEELMGHLSAQKLFVEVGPDGFEVWIILGRRWNTCYAKRQLEALLRRLRVVGEVFPKKNMPIWLPLASFKTAYTNQSDSTGDVVSFAKWLKSEGSAPLAEALDAFRFRLMETQVSNIVMPIQREVTRQPIISKNHSCGVLPMGLLSIPYQNEDSANNGPLKNRCWQQVTSFWQGESSDLDLDRALIISARLLAFEGLPQEEAEDLLLAYAEDIPNPTSSRLQERCKRTLLLKDIRKSVKRAYEDNGRQEAPDASSVILQNAVKVWKAKGLKLSDKATWRNVRGYLAVRLGDIECTDEEIEALEGGLRGLLSKRDLQGLNLREAVTRLARAVVRLVAGKETESLAVPYWSKYLSAETGMNFGNRNKVIRIRTIFIECGLIKVLKKGSEGCGGTRYGLGPVMAKRLNRPVLVSVGKIPEDWETLVEKVVSPYEDQMEEIQDRTFNEEVGAVPMGLLSIPYQKHKCLINSPKAFWEAHRKEAIRQADQESDREWEELLKAEGFG